MENLRWLLSKIRPYFPLVLLSILGSIVQSVGTGGTALLVKNLIDNVFILKDSEELMHVISYLLVLTVLVQVGYFLANFSIHVASERSLRDIREEVFRKLLYVPYNFFIKHPGGDLISRIVSDVEKVRVIFTDQIPFFVMDTFVVIGLVGVLIYRDPVLTAFLTVSVPTMGFAIRYFGGKTGKHLKRAQESVAALTQALSQTFHGIENIKIFSAEAKIFEVFKMINTKIYRSSVRTELYVTGNRVANYLLGYIVVAVILSYGGYRIVRGSLSAGDFVSYLTALFMLQPHLLSIQKALMNLRGTLPVVVRVREILALEQEKGGGLRFEGLREEILFTDTKVTVNGKKILKNVNLRVIKGERIGIVGHTGSGKSTLVKIIPRLVDYEGSVRIDGKELREFDLSSLRGRIGMATQETFLLNASVRENLLIAKPDASDRELWEVLKLALCDFVEDLDMIVGERGYSLSGGERQRLSLARLFLRNPEIVILDEATSALDMQTEKRVLKNLFEFFEGKTMFIVAHRLSNVIECERIIVMREGTIVEEGTFYTLVERKGEFYRIFRQGKVV